MGDDDPLRVTVVFADSQSEQIICLSLPADSTVIDAVVAAGLQTYLVRTTAGVEQVGIFGRRCGLNQRLSCGDRVELYRPLRDDPKMIRRRRATTDRKIKPEN